MTGIEPASRAWKARALPLSYTRRYGCGERIISRSGRTWTLDQPCSHGESFLAVLRNRFDQIGVYFLDEPEAALSFRSCLGLVALLDVLRGARSG